jgi:hypothetical protein
MSPTIEYASFLIRLWRKNSGANSDEPLDWSSEVEHVQSGERWTFESLSDLLGFLRRETESEQISSLPLNE